MENPYSGEVRRGCVAAVEAVRHAAEDEIAEMSAVMPIVAIVLVGLSLLGALPKDGLALLEHGLMVPAMLIPMLLRLDIYSVAPTVVSDARHQPRHRR